MKTGKRCIPTIYCGMNESNKDALTYKGTSLAGLIMCKEKKVDMTASKKPAVVIPKTLKLLKAGHRCKAQTTLITKEDAAVITKRIADYNKAKPGAPYSAKQQAGMKKDNQYRWALTPKECSARAVALQKTGSCNFYMHSDDFPVEGCACCDQYEPVADKVHNYNIF